MIGTNRKIDMTREMQYMSYIKSTCNREVEHDEISIINSILNALEEIQQYRALGTVEELKEAREKQISIGLVLDLAWRYGQIDGAHHKMWVIDQMVRALCGSEEEYKKWVSKYTDDDYDWDCGIAP